MIGLGSNRLTVCRRGGMSVTQAGRGGMEWMAGVRWPSWASPYSAQATAALKAQFPTQWLTIRDYGFAHPEIVGYMNAYAPEDAKIAYSLVPTLGVIRWCNNNGSACINTGIIPTIYSYIECQYKFNAFAHTGFLFGSVNTNAWTGLSMGHYNYAPMYINYAGNDRSLGYSSEVGVIYNVTYNCAEVYVNGVKRLDKQYGSYTFQYPFYVFSRDTAGSPDRTANMQYSVFKLYDEYGGTMQRYLVPFIHKDNGTDKYGMIDLLTGTFYGDATGNNGFTISETPAS